MAGILYTEDYVIVMKGKVVGETLKKDLKIRPSMEFQVRCSHCSFRWRCICSIRSDSEANDYAIEVLLISCDCFFNPILRLSGSGPVVFVLPILPAR